jgi:WS/DGAT/MGAT family acyltransferase
MPLDRLSPLDEAFLRIESDAAPMHVGWTLLVDGDPPPIASLRAHVEGRLGRLPRFRRRVVSSTLHLHDPIWVDDERFDITRHVQRVHLPAPGGRAQLRRLAGRLLSGRLDRREPLWRLYLVEGMRDDGFAIVGQAHHALVDGIAAIEVAALLLDASPRAPAAQLRRFSPEPVPGLRDRVLATAAGRARAGRAAAAAALRVLTDPTVAEDAAAALRQLSSTLATVGAPAQPAPFNRSLGPDRAVAFAELGLQAAKEIGAPYGATINDVVLTMVALAVGRHLRRGGESHPWLRVLVPVSTRGDGAAAELGNHVSVMFIELPIGERDPVAALTEVSRQTRQRKQSDQAGAVDGLIRAGTLVPIPVRDAVAWFATRPQTWAAVVSNMPGPSAPLYLLGRRVRGAYPSVPLVEGHGLAIGVLSYCGVLQVGLYADPALVPDLAVLARDFEAAFDALRSACAPGAPEPPAPASPQPSERVVRERALRERVLI